MARKGSQRRNSKMLTLRLDEELDGDLILWLAKIPDGQRSRAVRELMRDGLRTQKQRSELLQLVREAVSEALAGAHLTPSIQSSESLALNDVEESFGNKLDELMNGFHS